MSKAPLTTAQARAAWSPACSTSRTTARFHTGVQVTIDPRVVPAFAALDRILERHGYRPRPGVTGAYVCRRITGGTGYSLHAYGTAVDINWDTNPYRADGRPRAQPHAVLSKASPEVTYTTGQDGVVLRPQRSKHNPARIANRVFCRAQRRNGDLLYGMADLDDVVPGHPLSHGVIDRYIDAVEDVHVAPSKSALDARARKKLLQRISTYQTFTLDTMAWPVHEAFDTVGVSIAGDTELDGENVFHERRWSMVLRSRGGDEGTMTHDLARLVQVAES